MNELSDNGVRYLGGDTRVIPGNYLIAGGDGFIGHHLARRLIDESPLNRLVIVDNHLSSSPNLLGNHPQLARLSVDVCSLETRSIPHVDVVYHLASLASPLVYVNSPQEVLDANSIGTRRLLEIAKRDSARFIFASSSEIYGKAHFNRGLVESDAGPARICERSCYANSKRFGEELVNAARRRGVDGVSVRLFNVYGPGMDIQNASSGRVIPNFLRAVEQGESLPVHGDGSQIRSFTWIEDAVDALVALAYFEESLPPAINIGKDEPVTILELAHKILEITKSEVGIAHLPRSDDEPSWRRPDSSLARNLLGWDPRTSLDEGLRRLMKLGGLERKKTDRPTRASNFYETLGKANGYFEYGRLMETLGLLDELAESPKASRDMLLLHACLRELVLDLTGALTDVERLPEDTEMLLSQARILAKMGRGDEASDIMERISARDDILQARDQDDIPYALGHTGRRGDLTILGISDLHDLEKLPLLEPFAVGTYIEELLAFGAFSTCEKYLIECGLSESFGNELQTAIKMKNLDRLPGTPGLLPEDRLTATLKGIPGWFSVNEGHILSDIASHVENHHNIVEIGSWHGRSTLALSLGSQEGNGCAIHAIDPHSGIEGHNGSESFSSLKKNLFENRLSDNVMVHRTTSVEAIFEWNEKPIGLLFIDGLHDYASVKIDFETWSPHVVQGGYIAFHDAVQPGPSTLILELLEKRRDMTPLGLRDSLFVFQVAPDPDGITYRKTWISFLSARLEAHDFWIDHDKRRIRFQCERLFSKLLGELSEV